MQGTTTGTGTSGEQLKIKLPKWNDARQLLPLFGRQAYAVEEPDCEGEPREVEGIAVVAYGIHADPAVREARVLRGLALAILPPTSPRELVDRLIDRLRQARA